MSLQAPNAHLKCVLFSLQSGMHKAGRSACGLSEAAVIDGVEISAPSA